MLNLQEIFDQGSDLLADAIKFESNNTILALKLYNESLIIFSNVDNSISSWRFDYFNKKKY